MQTIKQQRDENRKHQVLDTDSQGQETIEIVLDN